MTTSGISTVGVIGAGQMGGGIARTAAERGYRVLLADINKEAAETGKAKISRSLERGLSKGKITQEHFDAKEGDVSLLSTTITASNAVSPRVAGGNFGIGSRSANRDGRSARGWKVFAFGTRV